MSAISNIRNILQGDSIKARSARGMIKLGAGTGVERILRLVRTIILTRILAADQFGLMAIVLVIVNVFEQLSEVGLKLSVVQNKRGSEPEYLNATWWFQAIRGLGLFAAAFLAAPWVSSFYDKPNLLKYLQVALLAIIFRGFVSPLAHALRREFKFGLMVLHVQGSALLGTIITIVCAFVFKDIWALIIGYVVENFFLCLLSYIIAPFKPRLSLDRSCLKELTAFARGMFGVPSLSLIGYAAPTFVLGKMVTEEQLGLYVLAGQLISIPLDFFTKIISPVLLTGFAKKQDDIVSLNNAVLRISELIAVVSLPLVGYIMVCAPALMFFLWGPQYIDATIPCVLLGLLIASRTQSSVLGTVYVAVGRPYLHRRYVILMTSVIILLIYPAVRYYGLAGAAMTSVAGSYSALFMQIFWSRRAIPLKFGRYIGCFIPGLMMTFPTAIAIRLLLLFNINSLILILVVGAVLLLVTYFVYFGNIFMINRKNFILCKINT
jgi:O-antigen/teichoic acid export membrane protein